MSDALETAEVARLQAELDLANARLAERHLRTRSVVTGVLVVMASLSVVLAGLAVWLHETLLDTDRFMSTITPVFSEEAVTDALGGYLTEQSFAALGVSERVEGTLARADAFVEEQVLGLIDLNPLIERRLAAIERPRFADLADPLVVAAKNSVEEAVQGYLASDDFQRTFESVATRSHETAVALARGQYDELPNFVVDDRSVRLDLTPAVAGVIQGAVRQGVDFVGFDPPAKFSEPLATPAAARAWMSDTLGFNAPDDFAQVTVMSSERLEDLQGVVRTFDRLVYLLVALVIALVVGAVWLSRRRGRTVIQLGLGVLLAVLFAGLIVQRLESVVIDAFGDPEGREAARVAVGQTVSSLESLGLVILLISVLVIVVPFGFTRAWHRKVAHWAGAEPGAPGLATTVVDHFDLLRVLGAVLALALLWFVGVGLWSVLVIGVAVAGYVAALSGIRSRTVDASDDDHEKMQA